MRYKYGAWYVTAIALVYATFLSICSVVLIFQFFRPDTVFVWRELLCFAATIAAWLYAISRKWGHRALIAVTAIVILAIGESDPNATRFHLAVLALLLLPFYTCRMNPQEKPLLAR